MRTTVYSFKELPVFLKMDQLHLRLSELAKSKEEFFDDLSPNQIPELWFSPNANFLGSVARLKLIVACPVSSFDPKASATLAQQLVDQTNFLGEIGNVVELPADCLGLSIKANVLPTNAVQISTLQPLAVKHLIKFFTKKDPFVRLRGRRRRLNIIFIKRYRFITVTELLKFFLFRLDQTQFNCFLPENKWKEFLSYIKSLRLFIVDLSGRKRN